MNFIKLIVAAIAGCVIGTAICWGLLIAYANFILHGQGSLFDTDPEAANAFFIAWGAISVTFMLVGMVVTARMLSVRAGRRSGQAEKAYD